MIDCLVVCLCVGPVMDWQPVQGAANLSFHDSRAICCEGMHYANDTVVQKQDVFSGCFYIYLLLYLLFIFKLFKSYVMPVHFLTGIIIKQNILHSSIS